MYTVKKADIYMTEKDLVLPKFRVLMNCAGRQSKTPIKRQIQAEFKHEKIVEMYFSFLHNSIQPYGSFWSHTVG